MTSEILREGWRGKFLQRSKIALTPVSRQVIVLYRRLAIFRKIGKF